MAEVDLRDIEVEDGVMTITVEPQDLSKAKEAIEQLIPGVEFRVMEDTMLANDTVELKGKTWICSSVSSHCSMMSTMCRTSIITSAISTRKPTVLCRMTEAFSIREPKCMLK